MVVGVNHVSSLEVYRETIYWKLILLLIALVDVPLIISLFYLLFVWSSSDLFELLVLVMVLVMITFIIFSFSRFSVVMTTSGITVGFGVSKGRFNWGEVEECYPDEASAVRYGGYGIRGGVYNGRKRLVYNVTGAKRVVLKVKGRKYDEFVFSTRNPKQCVRIIRMQIAEGTPFQRGVKQGAAEANQ
jgi:hypothetical protein